MSYIVKILWIEKLSLRNISPNQIEVKILNLDIFTDGVLLVIHLRLELEVKIELIEQRKTKPFKPVTHVT